MKENFYTQKFSNEFVCIEVKIYKEKKPEYVNTEREFEPHIIRVNCLSDGIDSSAET